MRSLLPNLPRFNTIGHDEKVNVLRSLRHPLSGYLGGEGASKGHFVTKLEREWAATFGVKHAIACNSATSGLLAAYSVAETAHLPRKRLAWVTPFTMSATAACAVFLGSDVRFIDIEETRYSLDPEKLPTGESKPDALIVANIFGHPAYLHKLRLWCDRNNVILIEDNAQSPFAMEDGQYAGTIGHIGVFSLNVHKHIQAGEGGVVVTNDDTLAERIRDVVNHGELNHGGGQYLGLNLRMTEPVAAIACAQLGKAAGIIHGRRELAHNLSEIFSLIPWVKPSGEDAGCTHVYYLWTARVPVEQGKLLVKKLNERNVPLRLGYSTPLDKLFKSAHSCTISEKINNSLISFEVCAYSPKAKHIEILKRIIEQVRDEIEYNDLAEKVA